MAITSLSFTSKTGNQVYGYYKSAIAAGARASDTTISSNTTLTANLNVYKTLTVNVSTTLTAVSNNEPTIIWADTIALNGTIAAGSQAGGAAGGQGGAGGTGAGALIIVAKQITGTGTITAAGGAGGNGSAPSTNLLGLSGKAAKYQTTTATTPSYGASQATTDRIITSVGTTTYSNLIWFFNWQENWFYIAGSGSGGSSHTTTANGYSLTGGSSIYSLSGDKNASMPASLSAGSSGGSGGGGGAIVVISQTAIPACTITAAGGNSGTSYSAGSYATSSGGGGGLVTIFAPSNGATVSVAGGSVGSVTGGGSAGYAGNAGSAGISLFVPMDLT